MAYSTKGLYKKALEVIGEVRPYWIEQLIAHMACSKPTFYKYLKVDSNEFNAIKELLEEIRIKDCLAQDKKWKDSDNATLQLAHRKLIGSDIERKNLSQSYHDHTTDGEPIGLDVKFVKSEKNTNSI